MAWITDRIRRKWTTIIRKRIIEREIQPRGSSGNIRQNEGAKPDLSLKDDDFECDSNSKTHPKNEVEIL